MSEIKSEEEKRPLRVRPEIHDLMNPTDDTGKIRRTLFILAYSKVLEAEESDLWSFYKIAGIHGLPYEVYDDVGAPPGQAPNEAWKGYCTHGSILFPTWHRAYMNLIEQAVRTQAVAVAKSENYKKNKHFLHEAENLSFPYWDWGAKGGVIPDFFVDHELKVVDWKLNEQSSPVPNPLAGYCLPVDLGTVRAVSNKYNPHAKPYYIVPPGNKDVLDRAIRPGLYQCLHTEHWREFSNHYSLASNANPPTDKKMLERWLEEEKPQVYGYYASLEVVHDAIHDYIGGDGGHMSFPEIAGFDPIFFLHHCQVDRLAAIWQALHPNEKMHEETDISSGTRTHLPGATIGPTTPLTPFRTSVGDTGSGCYDSNMVWNIHDLGYTYPGLDKPEALRDAYKPDTDPSDLTQWFVTVMPLQDLLVGKPYRLEVYLSLEEKDYNNEHQRSKKFVGAVYVFSNSNKKWCANCSKHAENGKRVCASFSLIPAMKNLGILIDTEDADGTRDAQAQSLTNELRFFIKVCGKNARPPHNADEDVLSVVNWTAPKALLRSAGAGEAKVQRKAWLVKHHHS
eukprot:TRINITY_DN694_c0_g1_i1.p1 TRINITY_DN694_c0_g1~~TRINITY_DN694_c0_g1_i1.p1  ORF type:complete len:565 (-),score=147.18 TRINITY_DN694_c0_g1_i1:263-1957(-)